MQIANNLIAQQALSMRNIRNKDSPSTLVL